LTSRRYNDREEVLAEEIRRLTKENDLAQQAGRPDDADQLLQELEEKLQEYVQLRKGQTFFYS
jgi:ATP-dependent protease HslVU (ClpYQ) peptidase subunit